MEFEVVGSCMREVGNLDTKGIEKQNMTKLQHLVYSIVEKGRKNVHCPSYAVWEVCK